MHFTKVFALAAIFATGVFAAPVAEAEPANPPPRPSRPRPTQISQNNYCGNGVAPYCCASDKFGFSNCVAMTQGSQCQTTIVCCNAQQSIQVCTGNINVIVGA
ncbi:hypothetical protein H2201_008364 [Coniosporium apollinis]|uniref:Hydrophobin 1 n=1 Tax=Coniosporium apollinis TaxID=61459 RepID=A0ABQ9NKL6_9PEZI|nr:hypothetical protein H2201_008364 [Coniosporium apollinis]